MGHRVLNPRSERRGRMPKFYRWYRPNDDLKNAKENVLTYTEHGRPSGKAFWVFDMEEKYRPSKRLYDGRVLVYIEFVDHSLITTDTNHVNFSDPEESGGEKDFPDKVLVKENEPGAYGIGKNVLSQL